MTARHDLHVISQKNAITKNTSTWINRYYMHNTGSHIKKIYVVSYTYY